MIGADLLRYDSEQKYCVWDLETSDLNLMYGLPWQCSFIICTLNRVLESHDYFVKWPNFKMSIDAARITNFNNQEYQQKARDPKEVLDILESYLNREDIIVVFHNGYGFDSLIHQSWRRKLGLEPNYGYLPRSIDTNAISKAYKKGIQIERDNLMAFQYKMINYREKGLKTSLGVMAREFDIQYDERDLHRGNKDILLNWELWKKLVWSVEI